MKLKIEDIPIALEGPNMVMRHMPGLGGMDITYNSLPKGTDFTPLLKGLRNDSCHSVHWGYMLEDMKAILFSPEKEHGEVLRHALKIAKG